MVNTVKDIVNRLDGYSFDNQGFAVASFVPLGLNGGSGAKLRVKPYLKNEEAEGIPEGGHLMEMVSRLLSRYSDETHYTVCKAEKMNGFWELQVQEIKEKTEEKTEEKTDEA